MSQNYFHSYINFFVYNQPYELGMVTEGWLIANSEKRCFMTLCPAQRELYQATDSTALKPIQSSCLSWILVPDIKPAPDSLKHYQILSHSPDVP